MRSVRGHAMIPTGGIIQQYSSGTRKGYNQGVDKKAMSLTATRRKSIIEEYRTNEKDSGSSEVQVAILTNRISALTEHLKLHPKDLHTRLGLSNLVARRTRLLTYLRENNAQRYRTLIDRLGLRK